MYFVFFVRMKDCRIAQVRKLVFGCFVYWETPID